MTFTAYWWSPRRDRRALASELRHNNVAWHHMRKFGGTSLRNFGDELSARVLHHAIGINPSWAPLATADVVAIGSILDLYTERGGRGVIWGSGLRSSPKTTVQPPARIAAVRGALTRDALGLARDTPLGDPGLVARVMFSSGRRSGTLVLPHFSAFKFREGRAAIDSLRRQGHRVIAPSAPVDEVCSAIGQSDHVLTSSLHGQVVADALRVPSSLINFVHTREPAYKYDDYNSVFGLRGHFEPVSAALDATNLTKLRAKASERVEGIDSRVDELIEDLLTSARGIV